MKTLAELQAIRDKARVEMTMRGDNRQATRVLVGMATCGIAAGAKPVLNAILEETVKRRLEHVIVTQTGCVGMCQHEPIVEVITPDGQKVTYGKMTPEKAVRVVVDHLVNGNPVKEYTIGHLLKETGR